MAVSVKRKLQVVATEPQARTVTACDVLAWIEAREPRAELDVLVTPEIAQTILQFNEAGVTNRRLLRRNLENAVRALQAGMWENTGEPIIISDRRTLNDGQHRLEAIVQAGIPAVMDIRFGVPRHAFASTNTGRSRSAGDVLSIAQVPDGPALSMILRLVLLYERGLPTSLLTRISNAEILAAYERWPDIGETTKISRMQHGPVKAGAIRAMGFLTARSGPAKAREAFFHVIKTGEGTAADPAHRLREYFLRKATQRPSRDGRAEDLAHCIIAWNLYRDPGRWSGRVLWRKQDKFPKIEHLQL